MLIHKLQVQGTYVTWCKNKFYSFDLRKKLIS